MSPDSFNFFQNIQDKGEKSIHELTDPHEDTIDTLQNNIQKAFGFVGEKIEGLVFSADVFLSKQKNDNKTSNLLEENIFFGKINGQKTTDPKTTPTGISSGGDGSGESGSGGSQPINNNGNNNQANIPPIIQNPTTIATEIPFDTLSLITKKQSDNRVSMNYDDTSGKTTSVTVQIRNKEQVLFTGQFFSPSFETTIMDLSATPHFIDLVVEHPVYGQVIATAFIPAGSTDTVIYGVFSKN
ncbi:MAG: hypothetical protein ACT4NJ_07135 [Nitrosopumilaceae archaeon]